MFGNLQASLIAITVFMSTVLLLQEESFFNCWIAYVLQTWLDLQRSTQQATTSSWIETGSLNRNKTFLRSASWKR